MPVQIGPFTIGPPDSSQPSQGYDPSQSLAGGGAATPAAATATATPGQPFQPTDAQLAVLQGLLAQEGGLLGQPVPATVKDPVTGASSPDPSGAMTFTFGNGGSIDIDPSGGTSNFKHASSPAAQTSTITANTTDPKILIRDPTSPGGIRTIDNPNYQPPKQTPVSTNTTDPKIVLQDPKDPTNLITVDNPNYKQPVPTTVATNTTDPTIVSRDASGNITTQPNPNYQPPAAAPVATNTTDPYIVMRDPKTGATSTQPNPNYNKPAAAPVATNTTDPYIVMRDPTSGATTTVQNPNYQKPAAAVVGSPGTTDPFIITRDPTTGAMSQQPNPNYVAPKPTVVSTTTTNPYITTQDPKTGALTSMPNPSYQPTDPGRMVQQLQGQATQQQQALQQQVQAGKLTADQASSQFDQWWNTNVEPMKGDIANLQATQQADLAQKQAYANYYASIPGQQQATLAETAANNAQNNFLRAIPYMANPNAQQMLSQAINPTGGAKIGKVQFPSFNPAAAMQAFTFSAPNLQEIGRQGAAAALAHISPTAQMHLQTPGPIGQAAVGGMPDINSLLNQSQYGFGAGTPTGPFGSTPMAQPGGPTSIPNPNYVPPTYAPGQTGATIPGLDLSQMPGYNPATMPAGMGQYNPYLVASSPGGQQLAAGGAVVM
jgi:hypothetical protein